VSRNLTTLSIEALPALGVLNVSQQALLLSLVVTDVKGVTAVVVLEHADGLLLIVVWILVAACCHRVETVLVLRRNYLSATVDLICRVCRACFGNFLARAGLAGHGT